MCELLFMLYSQLLKIVETEKWQIEYRYFKKGIYEILMELELHVFPSCCSCLNPNSYECNLPFGCMNTVCAQSKSFRSPRQC